MAEQEEQILTLRDDFYRDSFARVLLIIISLLGALTILIGITLYLHFTIPDPITFKVDKEWHVLASVPIDQPYRSDADLLQWVSQVVPNVFNLDFINYNDELKGYSQYFTSNGWNVFLNQLNNYANYNNVQKDKSFIYADPTGAPAILQQGLLSGRYGWWVQMPIDVYYSNSTSKTSLMLQVLVVRVSTLNNLSGLGIENMIVSKVTKIQI